MTERSQPSDLLAVYGTLRRRSIFRKLPRAVSRLRFSGFGLIRGLVFWQGRFPALVPAPGIAQVELFRVLDQTVWRDLDFYEGCDPADPQGSLFLRRRVLLANPREVAWAYFLNRRIPLGEEVEGRFS